MRSREMASQLASLRLGPRDEFWGSMEPLRGRCESPANQAMDETPRRADRASLPALVIARR
jgi:hypothetical protein